MQDFSDHSNQLATQFRQELPIRRTTAVLERKRRRIVEDIEQLIEHLGLLIPAPAGEKYSDRANPEVLEQALSRLGDDAFTQLVLQIARASESKR